MHVTLELLAGRVRTASVARARVSVWRWLRSEGLSWPEIGQLFGRDHTTVMVQVKAVEPTAEKIAVWLGRVDVEDGDARSFVCDVDRLRLAAMIREGAWR
jgi:hypothetical protein